MLDTFYMHATLCIILGLSEEELIYWCDQFLRVESYDISGENPDDATVIETILLEPIVNIKALAYNNFEIKRAKRYGNGSG